MTPSDLPSAPPPRRRRRGRTIVLSIAFGVILGVFVSVVIDILRPRETGLVAADIVMLEDGGPAPGSSYVLEIEPAREGYPVVLHVDEDGFPSLLFPTNGIARLGAGHRTRLPDPGGNTTWWVGPDQQGTLLTVLAENPPSDVDRLVELVERAAARADDPDEALDSVISVLRRRLGEPLARRLRTPDRG